MPAMPAAAVPAVPAGVRAAAAASAAAVPAQAHHARPALGSDQAQDIPGLSAECYSWDTGLHTRWFETERGLQGIL